jgi:protein-disulfide isomerase
MRAMIRRRAVLAAFAAASVAAFGLAQARAKPRPAAGPVAASIEKQLADYAAHYLPFDPQTKITVSKAPQKLPGFTAWKVTRKGRYETLNTEATVLVSNDRKWFYEGDSFANKSARPVRSGNELDWVASQYAQLLKTNVRALLSPERNAMGLLGTTLILESGYGPVRLPGLVTPDGGVYLSGTLWDFQSDPRAERRKRIDLGAQRAQGNPGAPVTIVEYADMECSYCKYRGMQLDRLIAANAGVVNVRRHYKFFPLWSHHAWAMKAASAGDCLSRLASPDALFRFKELVYGRQESLSVSAIDELALTSAEGEGVDRSEFLGCYLRDDSFDRVRRDLEEGYRLSVNSTPTYFVDGTHVSWIEDKVMEDFLKARFPKLKSIPYPKP